MAFRDKIDFLTMHVANLIEWIFIGMQECVPTVMQYRSDRRSSVRAVSFAGLHMPCTPWPLIAIAKLETDNYTTLIRLHGRKTVRKLRFLFTVALFAHKTAQAHGHE